MIKKPTAIAIITAIVDQISLLFALVKLGFRKKKKKRGFHVQIPVSIQQEQLYNHRSCASCCQMYWERSMLVVRRIIKII
jgi:hypothetical protein